jgi:hypothetical protein
MRLHFAAGLAAIAFFAFAAPAAAQQKTDEELFKLVKTERIGALHIGMTEAQVKQLLSAKPARGADRHWAADGQYHQKWTYAREGLTLTMVSEKKGGAKMVETIDCGARCTLKSTRGIGIGSTLADVQKAYAAEFNKDESKLPGVFVAGTVYGGLIFNFKGGKASQMFLGAAAE